MFATLRLCVIALGISLAPFASAQAQMAATEAASPRQVTSLSDGWRFRFGDAPAAVTAAGFDDSSWAIVSVPHTWNHLGEYSTTRAAATDNKQGVGWYRLTVNAPAAAKGRRQYLDFAAVAIIADVWVNGTHVGQHKGAFSRFRFDVTAAWKPSAANVIVVKADNSKPAPGSSTENVIPLAGDFFIHGGIYRGVSLIEANDVGIDLLDYGGPGVYVRASDVAQVVYISPKQPDITEADFRHRATVALTTRLRNTQSQRRHLRIATSIKAIIWHPCNPDVVQTDCGFSTPARYMNWEASNSFVAAPNSTGEVHSSIVIDDPHLWLGRDDPYQYTAIVTVFDGKTLIDSVTVPFGIRDFKFDPNTGFSLNGKPLKLKGVSRHQDREGRGYALTRADHKQDMDLIAEMGANAVRMAHYQHDDAWVEEADTHGMVAWAEVPYVTTPSLNGGEGSPALFANAEQQTRELIRQLYNHPSIMMWSVGNEVDAATMFGASKEPVKPLKLLQRIAAIAKEEDPSRPTVFADCCEDVRISSMSGDDLSVKSDKVLAGTADLIGYNRYYGWYYPQPLKAAEQLAAQMDKFHAKHPALPISISEYGAGGAISQHSDSPLTGFVNAIGRPQPEEYESWVHEQSWPVIRDRPFIFGSYVWNMFDFVSDLRNEGDSVDINTKGLVTFDRKTKKDAFFYYQAQWSATPMIHINSSRYVDRAYAVTDVRAYSNASQASLIINGRSVGTVPCPDHICVWPGVALQPGANAVVATGNPGVTDSVTWNGPDPAKDGIRIDVGDNAGRALGVRRFGSDNFVTGGTTAVLNMGGFGGRTSGPKKTVTAPDPALYDYWREGAAFSYAIPVPNGKWTVTIHSFEPRNTGSPMMSVTANGKLVVRPFNVSDAAGGSLKGLARSFPVKVKDGVLKLDIAATGGKAVVAAIEVTK